MLDVWILDVGHGDSIVLRNTVNGKSHYAVIDSCKNNSIDGSTKALHKLRELGAENLSFIMLTHPHKDHYSGMLEILKEYKDHIKQFYTFPLDHYNKGRYKKITESYKKLASETDSRTLIQGIKELLSILTFAQKYIPSCCWLEPTGFENRIRPDGFDNCELNILLPPPSVKGSFFAIMDQGTKGFDQLTTETENSLSIALHLKYEGTEIILGGDGTHQHWNLLMRHHRFKENAFGANIVKLPHHGSKHDCKKKVLDFLYSDGEKNIALISANGKTHPDDEVLDILENSGVKPYCTGLAKKCGNTIQTLINEPNIDPKLNRILNLFRYEGDSTSGHQKCQGDIQVSISNGSLDIKPEVNNFCPYRDTAAVFT